MRIAFAPGMLGAAYSNSKVGFVILLSLALVTDAVDGFFARRWQAETAMGQRLDHWGDALTMSLGALGVFFLWPAPLEREWIAGVVALVAYLAIGIDRWRRRREPKPSPQGWKKLLGFILPLSLIPLITDWSPWPFRLAAVLQVLLALAKILEARKLSRTEAQAQQLAAMQSRGGGSAG